MRVDRWQEGDEEKLGELILYVAEKLLTDPPGGATKLNKVLYFAEFSSIRAHGSPITGVAYQKLANGPAPRRLVPVRDRLIDDGAALLRMDNYFGKPLQRLIPLRHAEVSRFSAEELEIIDQVIGALWGKTANEVSRMSHDEQGWKIVEEGEDIPLATAYLAKKAVLTDNVRKHAQELAEKLASPRS